MTGSVQEFLLIFQVLPISGEITMEHYSLMTYLHLSPLTPDWGKVIHMFVVDISAFVEDDAGLGSIKQNIYGLYVQLSLYCARPL